MTSKRARLAAFGLAASFILTIPLTPAGAAGIVDIEPLEAIEVGSIAGWITAGDGEELDYGLAEVFDPETGALVGDASTDRNGNYEVGNLDPGQYLVLLSNADDMWFYDYFPVWFDDAPLHRLERATPVEVVGGQTTTGVDARLALFYDDMFDTNFNDDILWMHGTSLTTGCTATSYCPGEPVTRGQMAAFLVRALSLTATDNGIEFSDDDNSVFERDIEILATVGITKGCGPDIFCPDEPVTRGQMAAFLVRALGYTDRGNVDFTDDNGSVFEADIEQLATAGVTTGCGPATFCPNDNVTRGQMAAFLHRALGGGVLYPGSADLRTLETASSRSLMG